MIGMGIRGFLTEVLGATLGTPLTMTLDIPLYPRPIKPSKDPFPGLVHAQMGSQEVGVGHKQNLTHVCSRDYKLFRDSPLSFHYPV